jgi:hypothetical protein
VRNGQTERGVRREDKMKDDSWKLTKLDKRESIREGKIKRRSRKNIPRTPRVIKERILVGSLKTAGLIRKKGAPKT